jgi:hypothetical protein
MRKLFIIALVSSFLALPVIATAQSHGHGGGSAKGMNHDAHGDLVSATAKDAKADGQKVGANVHSVAQDKAHGKGLTKSHGKGH